MKTNRKLNGLRKKIKTVKSQSVVLSPVPRNGYAAGVILTNPASD